MALTYQVVLEEEMSMRKFFELTDWCSANISYGEVDWVRERGTTNIFWFRHKTDAAMFALKWL